MVSVHAWTSFLPDMHLHLFGCSRASAYQCSVRPGLVHGKFKNQTRFRYQLPSLHSQTCFSALCELNTQTLNYLKKKNPFPYHFFLANMRKHLKPKKWQHLKSSCHSLRSVPGDAVHSLMPWWVCRCICSSEVQDRNNYLPRVK